jgi:hypothetical protein
MNRTWHVVVAFLVVFVAGGAIGTVYTLHYGPKLPPPAPLPQPEQFGPNLMRRWMNNNLHLTPAQIARIRPMIRDAAEDIRRTQSESAHSTQLILEHMQDEIATVLDPEQRNQLDNMIDENRARLQQFRQFMQQERQAFRDQEKAPAN